MPHDFLIRTKLRQPFTRPGLVPRPRLQARVAEGLGCPLTLVIAPAGFGKTTLVTASLAGSPARAAWLSLDAGDNQAGRFLTYLIAALQTACAPIGAEAVQLMAGLQPAPEEAVLTSLVNDLDGCGKEIALVLDDYQLISSPAVHANVTFLLEHCPRAFHLLISTRSDPPLPLARLRARGQLVELRAADLRFNPLEAAQLVNSMLGLDLDTASIEVLEERTEGWAAGLQMAALSMRERGDIRGFIEGFSGTNRHILDYLMEEILAGQAPEIQRFLLRTSVLERMCAPLCDALLDEEGRENPSRRSAAVLETLERENLFLVPLDEERIWSRYHHLFADLLRARLHVSQPELVPLLHRRAAGWLEQKGYIPEGIQHLFAAREPDRAANLIERHGPARWAENDLAVIQMAENLPPEMLILRPRIGMHQAWLLISQGQVGKALPLLKAILRSDAGSNPEQSWVQTVAGLALAFLGRRTSDDGIILFPEYQALDAIPADEPILREAAQVLYAMTLSRLGELDRSAEFAEQALRDEKTGHRTQTSYEGVQAPHKGVQAIPSLVPFLATGYFFQGRLHAAAALCREHLEPVRERGIHHSSAGNLDIILGSTLYEWNRLEEAEALIREGLRSNEPWGNIMTDAFGLLALAHLLLAKGEYGEATQTIEKFEARLQDPSRPMEFSEPFRSLRAQALLERGDLQAAGDWADQIMRGEDFQLHPAHYRLILARIRLAQGRHAEAEALLAGKQSSDLAGDRVARRIESDLLLAAALAGQGRMPEALELAEACLALGEAEGHLRVFLDAGKPARDLLAAFQRSGTAAHSRYAQKTLEAFPPLDGARPPASQPGGLIEPLSGRELEVLGLMALGKTNEEIARQLVVARGTIKAHAASIYRKLDAANRTEAVARARQAGLLP